MAGLRDFFGGGDDSIDYKKAERAAGMPRWEQTKRTFRDIKDTVTGLGKKGVIKALGRGAKTVGLRAALPVATAYGLAKAGAAVFDRLADDKQEEALSSYNTAEDRQAFREAQQGLRPRITPTVRTRNPEGTTRLPDDMVRRKTPQEEAGVPDAIGRDGEPFYKGPDRKSGRLSDPIGVTDSGVPMFQDSANSFSDRGQRGSAPFSQTADLTERLASLDRQYQSLRDSNRAREEGFDDVEDFRQAALEQQVLGLRMAGAEDQAIAQIASQGGLRGLAPEATRGTLRDQVALANLNRNLSNDAFNRQLQTGKLRISKQNAETGEANRARGELNDIQSLLASEDDADREQGVARARSVLLSDPNLEGPESNAILNWAIESGETGWLEDLLTFGQGAPRPKTPGDLRNYRIDGDELKKEGNQFVGINLPPEIIRIIEAHKNAQRGIR